MHLSIPIRTKLLFSQAATASTDRQRMVEVIQTLEKPVIHYKVLPGERNDPEEAVAYTARIMRNGDAVCVGIYPKDNPKMLSEDIRLLQRYLNPTAEKPSPETPETR